MYIDVYRATEGLQPGMDPELSYNYSGAYDPTAGVALSRIFASEKAERDREAWIRIAQLEQARKMAS